MLNIMKVLLMCTFGFMLYPGIAQGSERYITAPQESSGSSSDKSEKISIIQFYDKELQKEYEIEKLKYDKWRFEFIEKMHEDQKKETEKYSGFILCSLNIMFFFLIFSLLVSGIYSFNNKDNFSVEAYGFKIQLTINSILFVMVLWLSFLQYLYITQMYVIT